MASITEVADRHAAAVEARDEATLRELIRAYQPVYERVQSQLATLQRQIDAARAAGEDVGPAWLFRQQRLSLLERQIEDTVRTFARDAQDSIEAQQEAMAILGQDQVRETVAQQLVSPRRGVTTQFTSLPREDLLAQVGFLGDGSPLTSLLSQLGPDAALAVRQALIVAAGTGAGADQTARRIRQALGGNLNRALTIARTEGMRSHREASFQSAQRNADIMKGWVWHAHLGPRTCMVCLAQHGTFHQPSERLPAHVNCRCSQLWITKSWEELGFTGITDTSVQPDEIESGEQWFRRNSPRQQRSLLGPSKYAAWKDGAIALRDLVGTRQSADWGPSVYERSLRDILGNDVAKRYYPGGPGNPSPTPTPRSRPQTSPPTPPAQPPRQPPPQPPAPPSSGGSPASTPNVSAALDIQRPSSRTGTSLQHAMDVIDSVHGDGQLPRIPVHETARPNPQGQYSWAQSGAPDQIQISSVGVRQGISFVHETGHFLDHQVLGPRPSQFGTIRPTQAEMADLMSTASSSSTIASLERSLRTGLMQITQNGQPVYVPAQADHLRYLLDPREIFARAYAQYITEKSQDPSLITQLQELQAMQGYKYQWPTADFRPIGQAFDRLFRAKGWLR